MANQEHFDILRQGIDIWNTWRKEHPQEQPDLSHISFTGTNITGVNLSGANFHFANLSNCNLINADLSNADLTLADLSNTLLPGADLTNAILGRTTLGDLDLRVIKGIETIRHLGPSTLGINTIYLSGGDVPEVFLRGVGIVDDTFITYTRSLIDNPIQYNSCFISYSSADQQIAYRLYADLRSKNVGCWFAPHDMKTGDRIRPRIYEQIWFNDKLLLVLSESSVKSEWVDYEVETALAKERKEKRDILFPVRIDDAVMESTTAWAAHIQDARHITDFTRWKEHDEYQKGLTTLLRDLKQEVIKDRG